VNGSAGQLTPASWKGVSSVQGVSICNLPVRQPGPLRAAIQREASLPAFSSSSRGKL